MKTNKNLIVAVLTLLLLASCKKDGQMLTVINEDGTCVRELTRHVSPNELMDSDVYPENGKETDMVDWEQTWSLMGEDTRHPMPMTQEQYDSIQRNYHGEYVPEMVLKHYRREFKTVQEMSQNLPIKDTNLEVKGSLEKHFKWFYTDYVFEESFDYDTSREHSVRFLIPLDRFIGADSASYWFTGQPDLSQKRSGAELKELLDEIEAKISRWINANLFAETYDFIVENYDSIKNPPVSKEQFMALRDSLAMTPAILDLKPFDNDQKTARQVIEDHYKSNTYTNWYDKWRDSSPKEYTVWGGLMELFLDYDLVMPGKVTDAGMGLYDGEVIHYRLTGERLIPGPYTIAATSRVTNIWAFLVTFLVILLAIGSFFYRRK
jgi:hypothetical protein